MEKRKGKKMKKILFIVGSLRTQSFNKQIAEYVEGYLKGKAEITYLDYQEVPFINQDIEYPAPPEIVELRKTVGSADGLWVFSPEYNYSYPGAVKNIFDWLSRPLKPMDYESGSTIQGKKVTVSGIGGQAGTAGMRAKLHEFLGFIKAIPMVQDEAGLTVNPEAWATDQLTLSAEQKTALEAQADDFMNFI